MMESPIFVKTYELLLWLLPRTLKFSREYRFSLATRIQSNAFDLQRALLFAAKVKNVNHKRDALTRADIELAELRTNLRLASELQLLDAAGFEHSARLTNEVGRLLGGWLNKGGADTA